MGKLDEGGFNVDQLFKESQQYIENNPEKYGRLKEKYSMLLNQQTETTLINDGRVRVRTSYDSSIEGSTFEYKGHTIVLPKEFKIDTDGLIYRRDNPELMTLIIFCDLGVLFTDNKGIKLFVPYGLSMDAYDFELNRAYKHTAEAVKRILCNEGTLYVYPYTDEFLIDYFNYDKDGFYRSTGYDKISTVSIIGYIYATVLVSKLITAMSIYNKDGYMNMIEELLDSNEFYIMRDLNQTTIDYMLNGVISKILELNN